MNPARSHYDVLQIAPDASMEVIQGAYRALLKNAKGHPDLGGSEEAAKAINEAYSVLSHPEKRKAYDRELSRQRPARGHGVRERVRTEVVNVVQTQYVLICPNCRRRNLVDDRAAMEKMKCGHCGQVLLPPRNKPLDTDDKRAYRLGMYLYDKAMYDRARKEFQTAVRLKPDNAGYQYWLGRALYQQGSVEKARDAFQTAVTLNGSQFQSRFWLGQVLHRLRKFGEAIQVFEQALKLRPRHTGTLMRLAAGHFRVGEYDPAAKYLGAAIKSEPRRPDLHTLLGLVQLARKDVPAAQLAFKTADRLKPGDKLTQKYLALCEQKQAAPIPAARALWAAFRKGAPTHS
ncbi:MAG TPA: tetratricopeptide repeat protein [bacterium]